MDFFSIPSISSSTKGIFGKTSAFTAVLIKSGIFRIGTGFPEPRSAAPEIFRTPWSCLPSLLLITSSSPNIPSTPKAIRLSPIFKTRTDVSDKLSLFSFLWGIPKTLLSQTKESGLSFKVIVSLFSTVLISSFLTLATHSTLDEGRIKVCTAVLTTTPLNVATVIGRIILNLVPALIFVSTFMNPFNFSIISRTIASPNPLPDTSVIIWLVENPDLNISIKASFSVMPSASD